MTSKEIRALLDISRAEFSRRYGIPVRTLEDWDRGVSSPPAWALSLLEKVVVADLRREMAWEKSGKWRNGADS